MIYDLTLALTYEYHASVGGSRHHLRLMPRGVTGQNVLSSSLSIDPNPDEFRSFTDFYGNEVTAFTFRQPHDHLGARLTARVQVDRPDPALEFPTLLAAMPGEIARQHSLSPHSPHHYLHAGPYTPKTSELTDYAAALADSDMPVLDLAKALAARIHEEFRYDGAATDVSTTAEQAFALKGGVCQDFSHIMISALRGIGVPAGYVSGCLRTEPPAGQPRLEGADAMHAWVRVWCGPESGWQEFDPTNGIPASNDHIVIGLGRDFADVTPILGVVKTAGAQSGRQAVDVVPVE